jgi:Mg2+ and Co2+ transporter CorA
MTHPIDSPSPTALSEDQQLRSELEILRSNYGRLQSHCGKIEGTIAHQSDWIAKLESMLGADLATTVDQLRSDLAAEQERSRRLSDAMRKLAYALIDANEVMKTLSAAGLSPLTP